ncbi:MAG: hypothetical protein ACFFEF_07550 [Candidatus Thorarchaeota archaeon]
MIDKCPHCGGRLKEKHDESVVEQGRTVKYIHLRCITCGKWAKYKTED